MIVELPSREAAKRVRLPKRCTAALVFAIASIWLFVRASHAEDFPIARTAMAGVLLGQAVLSLFPWRWSLLSGRIFSHAFLVSGSIRGLTGDLEVSNAFALCALGVIGILATREKERASGTHPLDDDRHRHPIEEDRGEQHDRAQPRDH